MSRSPCDWLQFWKLFLVCQHSLSLPKERQLKVDVFIVDWLIWWLPWLSPVVCRCLRLCLYVWTFGSDLPSCGVVDNVKVGGNHLVTEIEAFVRQKMVRLDIYRTVNYFCSLWIFSNRYLFFDVWFSMPFFSHRFLLSPLFVSVASYVAWPINFRKSPTRFFSSQRLRRRQIRLGLGHFPFHCC